VFDGRLADAVTATELDQGGNGVSLVRWTFGLMNRLVRTSDLLLFFIAAALSALTPLASFANPLPALQIMLIALMQAVIFLEVMARMQAYRVERYTDLILAVLHVVGAIIPAWLAALLVLVAFAPETLQAPAYLTAWFGFAFVLLLASRQAQAVLLRAAAQRRLLRRHVVVVGAGPMAAQIIGDLSVAKEGETYDIAAVFRAPRDDAAVTQVAGVPVAGDLSALALYAQDNTIDILVVALPWSEAAELSVLVEQVSWIAADVVIPLDQQRVNLGFARIAHLGGRPTLQVMSRPFKGSQGVVKVIEDHAVAAVALVLLAPVMLLAAVAIKLESPGPILFRQLRPGFGTKPFTILKFRTMHHDPRDDATVGTTGPRDPRVTRVGAILRRLSLDELPQLVNVLRGEMSIVGPRPYVENMLVGNERFTDLVRQYAERHRIKPGITGYAQAHGLRSFALRDKHNARASIEMDLHYMRHWSLWLDLKIMVRTLVIGLTGRNVF
jgi:putative colanic acid biosynthesis UDP-glucose lipid carrier transferase